jgi:hypothetical protein
MKTQQSQNSLETKLFERKAMESICKDLAALDDISVYSLPLAQPPRRVQFILKNPDEDQICPITLDKITDFTKEYPYDFVDPRHPDYTVIRLPCKHEFTALPLIYYWTFSNNVNCPLCRSGPPNATLAQELPENIKRHFHYRNLWTIPVEERLHDYNLHFKLEGVDIPRTFVQVEYTELDGNVVLTAQGPEVERFLRETPVIRLHIVMEGGYYDDLWLTTWFHASSKIYIGENFQYTVNGQESIIFTISIAAFWLAWFIHDQDLQTRDIIYIPYMEEKKRLIIAARSVPPP